VTTPVADGHLRGLDDGVGGLVARLVHLADRAFGLVGLDLDHHLVAARVDLGAGLRLDGGDTLLGEHTVERLQRRLHTRADVGVVVLIERTQQVVADFGQLLDERRRRPLCGLFTPLLSAIFVVLEVRPGAGQRRLQLLDALAVFRCRRLGVGDLCLHLVCQRLVVVGDALDQLGVVRRLARRLLLACRLLAVLLCAGVLAHTRTQPARRHKGCKLDREQVWSPDSSGVAQWIRRHHRRCRRPQPDGVSPRRSHPAGRCPRR
jgi:hypothetical protein